jgi:hypothetical protein
MALADAMFRELKENGEATPRAPLTPDVLSRVTNTATYSELAKRWLSTP